MDQVLIIFDVILVPFLLQRPLKAYYFVLVIIKIVYQGKIQGGIATVPLFSWWPIKVYRPCPSYLAAGYVYRREGQTLDQVLFSEPSTKMKEKIEALRQQKQQLEEDQLMEDRKQSLVSKSEDQKELDEAVEAIWNDRKKK